MASQQDLDTFKSAVKGIKRIKHDKVPLTSYQKTPPTLSKGTIKQTTLELNETDRPAAVGAEAPLSYHQSGISHKILRNLRKGQYNIEAVLDLHGMTANEAKIAVSNFLQQCISDQIRVALIIHGKGRSTQAVLKNKLNQWLRGITDVLAFCTASTAHGSRGAMYVLLKRMREEK